MAFYEFETAYGAYPNAATAAEVITNTGIPGTNKFDPNPFGGNAIVLRVRGAPRVDVLPINGKGEVIDSSGKHILDPANPIWGREVPVIAWPE